MCDCLWQPQDYLGHHDFERVQLPAFSFPKSSFKLFNELLGLPVWSIRKTQANEIKWATIQLKNNDLTNQSII